MNKAFSRAGSISKTVLQEYRLENRTEQGRYQEWLTAHQSEIALTLKAGSRALRHWCAVNKMARRSIWKGNKTGSGTEMDAQG